MQKRLSFVSFPPAALFGNLFVQYTTFRAVPANFEDSNFNMSGGFHSKKESLNCISAIQANFRQDYKSI